MENGYHLERVERQEISPSRCCRDVKNVGRVVLNGYPLRNSVARLPNTGRQ